MEAVQTCGPSASAHDQSARGPASARRTAAQPGAPVGIAARPAVSERILSVPQVESTDPTWPVSKAKRAAGAVAKSGFGRRWRRREATPWRVSLP